MRKRYRHLVLLVLFLGSACSTWGQTLPNLLTESDQTETITSANMVEVHHLDSQGNLIGHSDIGSQSEAEKGNRAALQSAQISPVFSIPEDNPPLIRSFRFDGKEPEPGDAIAAQPVLKMDVYAMNLISTWSFTVFDSEHTVVAQQLANHGSTTQSATLTWQPPSALDAGTYKVIASVQDQVGHITTTSATSLIVATGFEVRDFLCGPNPFNPNRDRFTMEYTLTQASDVKIYVISLDGEQQWQYHALENDVNGGTAGFHQIEWNGRNRYGESLANGPYTAIINVRHGRQHKILKQKLLVLK